MRKVKDLRMRITKAVGTVVSLTDEQRNYDNYSFILRKIPIESLESVRTALKAELGKDYDCVRVKYRGPRPEVRLPVNEDNLLKIIALGKNMYRSKRHRASDCLKHDATSYAIYDYSYYVK